MSLPAMSRFAMALLMGVLLAGCSLLPEQEPVRLFTLPEPSISTSPEATRDLTLRVDTPSAGSPLDGARLLVMPSPGEFQAYAGARWRDDAPRLLRDHLIAAFRLDGRLAAVVDDASRARSDASLVSHLGAFHSRYRKGTPEVVLRLEVQLLDEASREVLASRRLEAVVASDDDSLEAVVEAFARAADRLAGELVDWTLARMARGSP
ncbi:ABC-type transport auxiliary lipoprotein family protein [Halomonas sp. ATCH28]|uniref:ABC-type transport auxiliary lipoprotein family protein n=1 Tax=Halomonas gemina TaxID=2945105 RepID=A0ABT0T179_9GAMM|nr:ABC-type transport auxiliary lipoprotein family protein [Halomonas gemina]MCL7940592.1 ABC-type transport auxiliary lipoprotein family protein [Halomonas gemina]